MALGRGFVKLVSPAILGIAKRNKPAARLAVNAVEGVVKTGRKVAKAAPVLGAGLIAADSYSTYQEGIQRGEDPGKAAFRGIGNVAGSVLGGIGGGALAGPLGGIAGTLGGGELGGKLGGKIWDSATAGFNQPQPEIPSVDEFRRRQRAMREQGYRVSRNNPNDMYNIGGFQYSRGADPTLVGLRLQQQGQNINVVQGYSRDKAAIAAQKELGLGQQYTDRYGIGQMNQTDRLGILQNNLTQRYGIGQQAGVENRRTLRDERLGLGQQYTDRTIGLGQQYTQRYGMDRTADVENRRTQGNVTLGLGQQFTDRYGMSLKANNERYGLDTQRKLGMGDLSLRDRERQDRSRQFDVDADIRRQMNNNNFGLGAMQTLAGLYR